MKLGNWLAVFGCVGLGIAGALSAEGCTATLTIGSCDGGCVLPADDSGIVTDCYNAVVGDSGSTPLQPLQHLSLQRSASAPCALRGGFHLSRGVPVRRDPDVRREQQLRHAVRGERQRRSARRSTTTCRSVTSSRSARAVRRPRAARRPAPRPPTTAPAGPPGLGPPRLHDRGRATRFRRPTPVRTRPVDAGTPAHRRRLRVDSASGERRQAAQCASQLAACAPKRLRQSGTHSACDGDSARAPSSSRRPRSPARRRAPSPLRLTLRSRTRVRARHRGRRAPSISTPAPADSGVAPVDAPSDHAGGRARDRRRLRGGRGRRRPVLERDLREPRLLDLPASRLLRRRWPPAKPTPRVRDPRHAASTHACHERRSDAGGRGLLAEPASTRRRLPSETSGRPSATAWSSRARTAARARASSARCRVRR